MPFPKTLHVPLNEIHSQIVCVLCGGYYIDATTIIECLHSFCKTCIVRYLETSKYCPICDVQVHKNKPLLNIRADHMLQDLVYKLVPGLFSREMCNRRKFYAETKEPADENNEADVRERFLFSQDEKISVCLKFSPDGKPIQECTSIDKTDGKDEVKELKMLEDRFLNCPGNFTVGSIKKFLRNKLCVTDDYKVDIFYSEVPLMDDYALMDVAYIYYWKRRRPLSLFYSIYQLCSPKVKRKKLDDKPVQKSLLSLPVSLPIKSIMAVAKENIRVKDDSNFPKQKIEMKKSSENTDFKSSPEVNKSKVSPKSKESAATNGSHVTAIKLYPSNKQFVDTYKNIFSCLESSLYSSGITVTKSNTDIKSSPNYLKASSQNFTNIASKKESSNTSVKKNNPPERYNSKSVLSKANEAYKFDASGCDSPSKPSSVNSSASHKQFFNSFNKFSPISTFNSSKMTPYITSKTIVRKNDDKSVRGRPKKLPHKTVPSSWKQQNNNEGNSSMSLNSDSKLFSKKPINPKLEKILSRVVPYSKERHVIETSCFNSSKNSFGESNSKMSPIIIEPKSMQNEDIKEILSNSLSSKSISEVKNEDMGFGNSLHKIKTEDSICSNKMLDFRDESFARIPYSNTSSTSEKNLSKMKSSNGSSYTSSSSNLSKITSSETLNTLSSQSFSNNSVKKDNFSVTGRHSAPMSSPDSRNEESNASRPKSASSSSSPTQKPRVFEVATAKTITDENKITIVKETARLNLYGHVICKTSKLETASDKFLFDKKSQNSGHVSKHLNMPAVPSSIVPKSSAVPASSKLGHSFNSSMSFKK